LISLFSIFLFLHQAPWRFMNIPIDLDRRFGVLAQTTAHLPTARRNRQDIGDLRAPAKNRPTSYWFFRSPAALNPPAHISICTGGFALQAKRDPSLSCGFISYRDP
jgi:hypothetical protein